MNEKQENNPREILATRIEPDVLERAERRAKKKHGLKLSQLVRQWVTEFANGDKK